MLVGLSFILWRLASAFGPWAISALFPLAICTGVGSWLLARAPWRARVRLALRPESALSPFITGRLRTMVVAVVFTFVSVALIAWLALRATGTQAAVMLALVFSAG